MIETFRLKLRPFIIEDTTEAFEWLGNTEVMKFIPGGADKSIEQSRNRISKYIDLYNRDGFSKFVIIEKKNNKLIGDCGIMKIEDLDLVELGYRISKNYWRHGYATEAAIAVLKYGFETLNFNEIYAIVESENAISQDMVKNKLCFSYQQNALHYGIEMELYKLEKKEYKTIKPKR